MGHIRLGVLPTSRKWRQVVEQLRLGADADLVAGCPAEAAEASLQAGVERPRLPSLLLAADPNPARSTWRCVRGRSASSWSSVPDQPSLMDVGAAISEAVDQYAREHGGAPISARWRRWRPSRASPRCWCQTCRRCSGRPRRKFSVLSGGSRAAPLQRSGAGVLRPPDSAHVEVFSQPRTGEPHRIRRRFRDDRARPVLTMLSTGTVERRRALSRRLQVGGTARTSTKARVSRPTP